jgi:mannose-6-phosphate isomerase
MVQHSEPLFLTAPLKERIWGTDYFKNVLHVTSSDEKIGEMWSCSGLEEASSFIDGGQYAGWSLFALYKSNKALFNCEADDFPILVKLLSTGDKLSVQVHPDDKLAHKLGLKCGKSEGWLILDSKPNSQLIIGTKAHDQEELRDYVAKGDYQGLLTKQEANKGDFFPIPSGTVHALEGGLTVLEIQQSADVTFRFYDYDRVDKNGLKRELQTEKAILAAKYVPYVHQPKDFFASGKIIRELWSNKYFKAFIVNAKGNYKFKKSSKFQVVSFCQGTGKVGPRQLKIGESFIIPAGDSEISFEGEGSFTITIPV